MAKQLDAQENESKKQRNIVVQTNFPQVSLTEALSIPGAIWTHYNGNPTHPIDVASALNRTVTNDSWRYLTGAAVAYDLTSGGYRASQIKLTSLGKRIVSQVKQQDVINAKREAIMKPRLMRTFFEHFNKLKFPDDAEIKHFLSNFGLPENKMQNAIRILKENAYEAQVLKYADNNQLHIEIDTSTIFPESETADIKTAQTSEIALLEGNETLDTSNFNVNDYMLKMIRLERFKKFASIEVRLRPFSVLMGENSSGKTTVLQAINSSLIILSTGNLINISSGGGRRNKY